MVLFFNVFKLNFYIAKRSFKLWRIPCNIIHVGTLANIPKFQVTVKIEIHRYIVSNFMLNQEGKVSRNTSKARVKFHLDMF